MNKYSTKIKVWRMVEITIYVALMHAIYFVAANHITKILPYTLLYYIVGKRAYEMLSILGLFIIVFGGGISLIFKIEVIKSKKK